MPTPPPTATSVGATRGEPPPRRSSASAIKAKLAGGVERGGAKAPVPPLETYDDASAGAPSNDPGPASAAEDGPGLAYESLGSAAGFTADWDGRWATLIQAADVRGAARQLADHCELAAATDRRIEIVLVPEKETLATSQVRARLEAAISQHLGRPITLSVRVGKPPRPTPAEVRLANENERMRKARQAMEQDPNVKAAQEAFGAVLEADTIVPRTGAD